VAVYQVIVVVAVVPPMIEETVEIIISLAVFDCLFSRIFYMKAGKGRTSVRATAKPIRELSLGLARPLMSLFSE
jgi:hypothetical protein